MGMSYAMMEFRSMATPLEPLDTLYSIEDEDDCNSGSDAVNTRIPTVTVTSAELSGFGTTLKVPQSSKPDRVDGGCMESPYQTQLNVLRTTVATLAGTVETLRTDLHS